MLKKKVPPYYFYLTTRLVHRNYAFLPYLHDNAMQFSVYKTCLISYVMNIFLSHIILYLGCRGQWRKEAKRCIIILHRCHKIHCTSSWQEKEDEFNDPFSLVCVVAFFALWWLSLVCNHHEMSFQVNCFFANRSHDMVQSKVFCKFELPLEFSHK